MPVAASLLDDLNVRISRLGLGDDDLLCHDGTGAGWAQNRLNGVWRQARAAVGVECRLHDLRHAYCTRLLVAGVNVAAVAAAAGHSSPTVTLSTYSHVLPTDDDRNTGRLPTD